MNEDPAQEWNSMLSGSGEDFANFLDFGELNFSTFADEAANLQHDDTGVAQGGPDDLDESMGGTADGMGRCHGHHSGHQLSQDEISMSLFDPTYHQKVAHYDQASQNGRGLEQQTWQAPNMVPPTPNSMELQAGQLQGFAEGPDQHRQRQMYEQYCRLQKSQVRTRS